MFTITTGYELTKSLTNVVIFIVSLYSLLHTEDKKWRLFFLLLSIDSFLGVIVHGIVMSNMFKTIIWTILSTTFVFSVHLLLYLFMNVSLKRCISYSLIVSVILLTLYYLKADFLLVFTFYVLFIMILSFYGIIKYNYKNKEWFIIGYIVQIIGGILLLSKVTFYYLDYNGIYHLFMALTLVFFYIGVNKKL